MTRSKALAAALRLIIVLSVFVTPIVVGQSPATRTQTKPPVNETRGVIRPQDLVVIPQTSTVPSLFGMNRNEVARVLKPLQLQPKFSGVENGIAMEQKPLAGTKVPYGSGVAVTLGFMPQLVLNGPAAPAYAGSELPFRVAFVPPLPAGPKPIFQFTWGDGSPVESTTKTRITHRFADAGARVVSVIWTLDNRVKIGSARVAVDVVAPPNTTQTSVVPLLFGMNRSQVVRVLRPLQLQPKFSGPDDGIALEQKPEAGTKVPYGRGVSVTLGSMPGLVLNGPAAPAYAGSELTFTVKFVPPLPAGPKPIYQFTWGDGSPVESTTKTVLTHRFADAGARVVSVIWTLDDRVKIGSARVAVDVLPPPNTTQTSVVPLLFGMNRSQVVRVLRPLQLQPKFSGPDNGIALEQKPEAGTKVPHGSGIAVTLGFMPQLVLNGPAAPAYAGSELTFTVKFVPPLPAGPKPIYQFTWGDGSAVESTTKSVITHRFTDAGARVVSVIWTLDDGVKIGSAGVTLDVLPPVTPTDTTPTNTDATSTVTTEGTATEPTTTTESTTSSATTTTAPITTTEPATDTIQTTTTTGTTGGGSPPNLLVWIGAAAVVLLLVVTFLLARVLRALNRNQPQVQAKSNVAFNGGMKPIEYEIEHPELIRRGPTIGLRGGIRGEGDGDV